MGCYFSCGGCGKESPGFDVCASDYSLKKNSALALVFSILHMVLSFTDISVSGMCDVFRYFPHVLPFPHRSLSLNEVNTTEWGLMTVRMRRKRVSVVND